MKPNSKIIEKWSLPITWFGNLEIQVLGQIKYTKSLKKKLKEVIELDINFEAEDALAKLEKLEVITNTEDKWFPVKTEEASSKLNEILELG